MEAYGDWWRDPATDIGQTENDEDGVDSIHARRFDGEWEYVRVWHHFGHARPVWRLRAGKLDTDP